MGCTGSFFVVFFFEFIMSFPSEKLLMSMIKYWKIVK